MSLNSTYGHAINPKIDDQCMDDLITTRCFVGFEFSQYCFPFSHCQCLCEATVIVGWMTPFVVLQVSLHTCIYYRVILQCVGACKCLFNSFAFFRLSVTNTSSVLSGCRLCFGVSPFKLCRSPRALRPSFLRSISLHVLFHVSAVQRFVNSFTCAATLL